MSKPVAKWKVGAKWLTLAAVGIFAFGAAGVLDPRLPIALLLLALLPVAWFATASAARFVLTKLPKAGKALVITGDRVLAIGILGLLAPQSRALSLLLIACGLRLSLSRVQRLRLSEF